MPAAARSSRPPLRWGRWPARSSAPSTWHWPAAMARPRPIPSPRAGLPVVKRSAAWASIAVAEPRAVVAHHDPAVGHRDLDGRRAVAGGVVEHVLDDALQPAGIDQPARRAVRAGRSCPARPRPRSVTNPPRSTQRRSAVAVPLSSRGDLEQVLDQPHAAGRPARGWRRRPGRGRAGWRPSSTRSAACAGRGRRPPRTAARARSAGCIASAIRSIASPSLATSSWPVALIRASSSPAVTRSAIEAARRSRSERPPASSRPSSAPPSAAATATSITVWRRSLSSWRCGGVGVAHVDLRPARRACAGPPTPPAGRSSCRCRRRPARCARRPAAAPAPTGSLAGSAERGSDGLVSG